ncbi:MAG: WYL domain-containing protein, partial [Bacteroidia bacterium]|nr:WYL domain-containing protein [Bacteroidia bacterium]
NYSYICAYEPYSNENKYFKIERISDIEVLEKKYKFKDRHEFKLPDAFGFPPEPDGKTIDIELRLKLRAYILLKEEYPSVSPFLKPDPQYDQNYILKTKVNDPKPILRFIMGLLDEVEVIGSLEFQEYLLGHIGRLFIMKPEEYSSGDTF